MPPVDSSIQTPFPQMLALSQGAVEPLGPEMWLAKVTHGVGVGLGTGFDPICGFLT